MRSVISGLRRWLGEVMNSLRRWRLRRRVRRLYREYHYLIQRDCIEAQENHRLPASAVRASLRFNHALDQLRQVDPDTPWRKL